MGIEITKKRVALLGLVLGAVGGIFACGGGGGSGGSSTSSSASTEVTTLVTSVNGDSNVICAKNSQCIDFIFSGVAKMPQTLSQAAHRPPKTGFDLTKAKELLDYEPMSIEATIPILLSEIAQFNEA